MFIYSMRGSTLKFFAVVIVSIGLLITLITIIPNGNAAVGAAGNEKGINSKNIKTNEDRISYLAQYGWEVESEAEEVTEVVIPKTFDAVYTKYNTVQQQQKYNLEKYRGKTVKRYTYKLTNYTEYTGTVYANLLIYKDTVIGGDICSATAEGFMHGFDPKNKLMY